MKFGEVERYHDVTATLTILLRRLFDGSLGRSVVCAVDDKLLRNTLRFDDDVINEDGHINDFKPLPSLALVPRVPDLLSRLHDGCGNNQSAVVTNLIDQRDLGYLEPDEATVARDESTGLLIPTSRRQLFTDVSISHDDTKGSLLAIGWRKTVGVPRVHLQM